MVGSNGVEPFTSSLSVTRSTDELTAHNLTNISVYCIRFYSKLKVTDTQSNMNISKIDKGFVIQGKDYSFLIGIFPKAYLLFS